MQTPPHSLESENNVLGACLVRSESFLDIAPLLTADDFYHPANKALYAAMVDLDAASKPIDMATVADQMRASGTWERLNSVGGDNYLIDLMASVVTFESLPHHAKLIRTKAERRKWANTMRELAAKAISDGGDAEYFATAEAELLKLTSGRKENEAAVRHFKSIMRDMATDLSARWERARAGGDQFEGIATGYGELDTTLFGMRPGGLYILAARPSMGKTALAMGVVLNVSASKIPTLTFSLEMGDGELGERMVSGDARVDSQRIQCASLDAKHWVALEKSFSRLAERPIYVSDRSVLTIAEIRSIARRWRMTEAAKSEHALVVVDYLQLVSSAANRKNSNREQDVSEISRGLKLLAREMKCPVLALSQLNRSLETRADKRPMLSDLRESGAIEQDADVVAFIYRDEVYSKDQCKEEDRGVAEVIVAKNRRGPNRTIRMTWLPQYTRFESLSSRDH